MRSSRRQRKRDKDTASWDAGSHDIGVEKSEDDNDDANLAETMRKHREMLREMKKKHRVSTKILKRVRKRDLYKHQIQQQAFHAFLSDNLTTCASESFYSGSLYSAIDLSSVGTTNLSLLIPETPSKKQGSISSFSPSAAASPSPSFSPSHASSYASAYSSTYASAFPYTIEEKPSTEQERSWKVEAEVRTDSDYQDEDFSRLFNRDKQKHQRKSRQKNKTTKGLASVREVVEIDEDGDAFYSSLEVEIEEEKEFIERFVDCLPIPEEKPPSVRRHVGSYEDDLKSFVDTIDNTDQKTSQVAEFKNQIQNCAAPMVVENDTDQNINFVDSFSKHQSPEKDVEKDMFQNDDDQPSLIENIDEDERDDFLDVTMSNQAIHGVEKTAAKNFVPASKEIDEENAGDVFVGSFSVDQSLQQDVEEHLFRDSLENISFIEKIEGDQSGEFVKTFTHSQVIGVGKEDEEDENDYASENFSDVLSMHHGIVSTQNQAREENKFSHLSPPITTRREEVVTHKELGSANDADVNEGKSLPRPDEIVEQPTKELDSLDPALLADEEKQKIDKILEGFFEEINAIDGDKSMEDSETKSKRDGVPQLDTDEGSDSLDVRIGKVENHEELMNEPIADLDQNLLSISMFLRQGDNSDLVKRPEQVDGDIGDENDIEVPSPIKDGVKEIDDMLDNFLRSMAEIDNGADYNHDDEDLNCTEDFIFPSPEKVRYESSKFASESSCPRGVLKAQQNAEDGVSNGEEGYKSVAEVPNVENLVFKSSLQHLHSKTERSSVVEIEGEQKHQSEVLLKRINNTGQNSKADEEAFAVEDFGNDTSLSSDFDLNIDNSVVKDEEMQDHCLESLPKSLPKSEDAISDKSADNLEIDGSSKCDLNVITERIFRRNDDAEKNITEALSLNEETTSGPLQKLEGPVSTASSINLHTVSTDQSPTPILGKVDDANFASTSPAGSAPKEDDSPVKSAFTSSSRSAPKEDDSPVKSAFTSSARSISKEDGSPAKSAFTSPPRSASKESAFPSLARSISKEDGSPAKSAFTSPPRSASKESAFPSLARSIPKEDDSPAKSAFTPPSRSILKEDDSPAKPAFTSPPRSASKESAFPSLTLSILKEGDSPVKSAFTLPARNIPKEDNSSVKSAFTSPARSIPKEGDSPVKSAFTPPSKTILDSPAKSAFTSPPRSALKDTAFPSPALSIPKEDDSPVKSAFTSPSRSAPKEPASPSLARSILKEVDSPVKLTFTSPAKSAPKESASPSPARSIPKEGDSLGKSAFTSPAKSAPKESAFPSPARSIPKSDDSPVKSAFTLPSRSTPKESASPSSARSIPKEGDSPVKSDFTSPAKSTPKESASPSPARSIPKSDDSPVKSAFTSPSRSAPKESASPSSARSIPKEVDSPVKPDFTSPAKSTSKESASPSPARSIPKEDDFQSRKNRQTERQTNQIPAMGRSSDDIKSQKDCLLTLPDESRSRITSPELNQSLGDNPEIFLSNAGGIDSTRPNDPVATALSRDSSEAETVIFQKAFQKISNIDTAPTMPSDVIIQIIPPKTTTDVSTRPSNPIATTLSQDLLEEEMEAAKRLNEKIASVSDLKMKSIENVTSVAEPQEEREHFKRPKNPVVSTLSRDSPHAKTQTVDQNIRDLSRKPFANLKESNKRLDTVASIEAERDEPSIVEDGKDSFQVEKHTGDQNMQDIPRTSFANPSISSERLDNISSPKAKGGDRNGEDVSKANTHTLRNPEKSLGNSNPVVFQDKSTVAKGRKEYSKVGMQSVQENSRKTEKSVGNSNKLNEGINFVVSLDKQRVGEGHKNVSKVKANSVQELIPQSEKSFVSLTASNEGIEPIVSPKGKMAESTVDDGVKIDSVNKDPANDRRLFNQDSASTISASSIPSLKSQKVNVDAGKPESQHDIPRPISSSQNIDASPSTSQRNSPRGVPAKNELPEDPDQSFYSIATPPPIPKNESRLTEFLGTSASKPPTIPRSATSTKSNSPKVPFHRTTERLSAGSPSRHFRARSRSERSPHRVETSRSPLFLERGEGRSSTGGDSTVGWYTSPSRSRRSTPSRQPLNSNRSISSPPASARKNDSFSVRSRSKPKKETDRSPVRSEITPNTMRTYASPSRSMKASMRSPLRGMYSLSNPPRSPAVSLFSRMPKKARSNIRRMQKKTSLVDEDEETHTDLLSVDTVRICNHKFAYRIHSQNGPCDRCWALASEEEREIFSSRGSHLRIAKTRSGCQRSCAIFPAEGKDSTPVRLCRPCFFATHQQVDGTSRLQVYKGSSVKVRPFR